MAHTNHAPAARGVSQLMYVGDDQPVVPAKFSVLTVALMLAVGWWLLRGK